MHGMRNLKFMLGRSYKRSDSYNNNTTANTKSHKTHSMCICTVDMRLVSQDKRADIASPCDNNGHSNTSVFKSVCGSV
jgi:hypothetical protein